MVMERAHTAHALISDTPLIRYPSSLPIVFFA